MRNLLILAMLGSAPFAHAETYLYRGYLSADNAPVNGSVELRIRAFDQAQGGKLTGHTWQQTVKLVDGHFSVPLELDTQAALYLQTEVRGPGDSVFSALPERVSAKSTLGGVCWGTSGDSGTNAAVNFLGTLDAQAINLRSNNRRVASFLSIPLAGGDTANTILGSSSNLAATGVRGATIGGGGVPSGDSDPSFANERPHIVSGHYGTIGGGFGNRAGFFELNSPVDTAFTTVAGGFGNSARRFGGSIGGGIENFTIDNFGTVAGGLFNAANGIAATVSGGTLNCAGGDYSWAGGRRARVRSGNDLVVDVDCGARSTDANGDEGSFLWADAQDADFLSSGPNQFAVRAAGGLYFGTSGAVNFPAGSFIATSTGATLSSGGTWTNASSRALKTAFSQVDVQQTLTRVLALPMLEWQYRASPEEGVHMGPIAEDFHAAFGLGANDASISTVDASGVALAAIQGLYQQQMQANTALQTQLNAQAKQIAELQQQLKAQKAP
jgi:trimeric autotransporter adhesin